LFTFSVFPLLRSIYLPLFSPAHRHGCVLQWLRTFEEAEGGLDRFTKGFEHYGVHVRDDNSVVAREWAPGAQALYLTGDFSRFDVAGFRFERFIYDTLEL
jgi:1,4-alpha-glucan branching enzyme